MCKLYFMKFLKGNWDAQLKEEKIHGRHEQCVQIAKGICLEWGVFRGPELQLKHMNGSERDFI